MVKLPPRLYGKLERRGDRFFSLTRWILITKKGSRGMRCTSSSGRETHWSPLRLNGSGAFGWGEGE
jgi:hypothetical protein